MLLADAGRTRQRRNPHVTHDHAGHRGCRDTAASLWRTDERVVRVGVIDAMVRLALAIDRRAVHTAALNTEVEETVPGRGPQICLRRIERDEFALRAFGIDLVVARDDAPRHDTFRVAS